MSDPTALFRPAVARLAGYVPGEQPQETGWVKLNTNENPYPPSPRVIDALDEAIRGPLGIYPDPLSTRLRERIAGLFDVDPDGVLPANGSDENLTVLFRTFVDPGETIAYPYPSYILYETIAGIQDGRVERLPLDANWNFTPECQSVVERAKMVLVPNPNSPSGNRWTDEEILNLVPPNGILVLDEAYGDFADVPHRADLLRHELGERIVITRTLSKSYSLAGLRFGFSLASPVLTEGMRRVKDSYNCDRLALAGAYAALGDQEWMRSNVEKIRRTRGRLESALAELGFAVTPSEANFVWCTHPSGDHERIYQELKARKILIRYMTFPDAFGTTTNDPPFDGLRITIGTDEQIDRVLEELRTIVG